MTGPEEKIARIKEEIKDVPIASYEEAAKFAEGYDLKNRQEELVKLLLKIDSLCRENDIKYSIAYGSNLGAYRYRRFIPWDDDADVMMTREEFNKLKAVVEKQDDCKIIKVLFTDRFVTSESMESYRFIDIFVFDEAPASSFARKCDVIKSKLYRLTIFTTDTMKKKSAKKKGIKKAVFVCAYLACILVGKIVLLFRKKDLIEKHEKMVVKNRKRSDKYMVSYTGTWDDLSRTYMKDWFEHYTEIEFEGHMFMCICDMEDFFINRYGNYKALPPAESCKPVHEIGIEERLPWQVRLDWK